MQLADGAQSNAGGHACNGNDSAHPVIYPEVAGCSAATSARTSTEKIPMRSRLFVNMLPSFGSKE